MEWMTKKDIYHASSSKFAKTLYDRVWKIRETTKNCLFSGQTVNIPEGICSILNMIND